MSLAGVIVMCAVFWGIVALARSWPRSAGYQRPTAGPARTGHEPRTHYRTPPDETEVEAPRATGPIYVYVDPLAVARRARARRAGRALL